MTDYDSPNFQLYAKVQSVQDESHIHSNNMIQSGKHIVSAKNLYRENRICALRCTMVHNREYLAFVILAVNKHKRELVSCDGGAQFMA
jgi:hypothetical protein